MGASWTETGARHAGGRGDVRALLSCPEASIALAEAGVTTSEQGLICDIASAEWEQFDRVRGLGGRAGCQDDARSFAVYRAAQYASLPYEALGPIASEHARALAAGRNLVAEKYARMMRVTDPELFMRDLHGAVPDPSPVKRAALDELLAILAPMEAEAVGAGGALAAHGRPSESSAGAVSSLDYLMAELEGYGLSTLWCLRDGLLRQAREHVNPIAATFENALRLARALEGQS